MARPPRVADGGFAYHVLNRGVGRRSVFRRRADYAAFLRVIDDVQVRVVVPVVAYCLMPNHYHLVLSPRRDGELSEFMRLLGVTHTQRFHAAHHTSGTGPIYQGRFKSFPVQDGGHALTVCRYVERNALRARLCDRAEDWPWDSAYRRYRCAEPRPAWLLDEAAWPTPPSRDYVAWLNAPQTPAEEDAVRTSIVRGRPLGDIHWTAATAERLGLQASLRPRGRPRSSRILDSTLASPPSPQLTSAARLKS